MGSHRVGHDWSDLAAAARKDWRQDEKGMTEDETVGWHHRLHEHEFQKTPGDWGIDREAWCAAVHGAAKSWTQLSYSTTTNSLPGNLVSHRGFTDHCSAQPGPKPHFLLHFLMLLCICSVQGSSQAAVNGFDNTSLTHLLPSQTCLNPPAFHLNKWATENIAKLSAISLSVTTLTFPLLWFWILFFKAFYSH